MKKKILLVTAMVICLAITATGTLAYFTAEDTHYKTRYIGIVNELLTTLMDAGDYTGVQHYATRAIELTPENIKAYYWLVCALTKLDCSELAKNEIAHAKKNPTAEEFPSLQKLMLSDSSLLRKTLFDEG